MTEQKSPQPERIPIEPPSAPSQTILWKGKDIHDLSREELIDLAETLVEALSEVQTSEHRHARALAEVHALKELYGGNKKSRIVWKKLTVCALGMFIIILGSLAGVYLIRILQQVANL